MDEFLDDMDDEQVDDLLMPEEDETSSSQMYEHFRFVADKGQSLLRVDKFLVDRMMGATRNRIQLAAEAGCILVNDKPVKSNYRVKPLDVVSIVMDRPRRELEIIPEDIPLNIVYEDDDLLVVNKPAGLVVHPGHGNYTGTLVNALAYYLKDDPYYDPSDPRLGLVHRIDKDTSGLLVVAKRPEAKSNLSLQFFNKTTKRKYRALVWGIVQEDEGRIAHGLGNARKLIEEVKNGTSPYHAIEVMACPGGCIGGGGQPFHRGRMEVLRRRASALYREDANKPLRKSHENPYIQQLYSEYLGEPCGPKAHKLLHTHYIDRKEVIGMYIETEKSK